jgi:hypothetical protein
MVNTTLRYKDICTMCRYTTNVVEDLATRREETDGRMIPKQLVKLDINLPRVFLHNILS